MKRAKMKNAPGEGDYILDTTNPKCSMGRQEAERHGHEIDRNRCFRDHGPDAVL
jgi:hypothetical protein